MITVQEVKAIVERHLMDTGHFLVDVVVRPGDKVVVEVDDPRSIRLEQLAALNKAIRADLDAGGHDVELQVGSPGMGRPFKVPEQYVKHTGRLVQVEMADGRKLEGLLEKVAPEGLVLRIQHPSKVKGRPAKLDPEPTLLAHTDIRETKASIKFN
ncbi:MAG: ribosome assembly cofactor RimP [Flavobacteriales bacterium]|nr:hypothetical protein [Flavobacteriales bacterium]MCB9166822.1 ribosome assembly cofactor RimP [Flavobacteriales bacterium]